ncbi:hypothetical protein IC235_02765 [Hymenobacter sp. BT664]|uniref:Uncharacterized protein n=1 Tax=Hymenobacter montanus TaxID=2771359 RepID=A0A927GI87_9BACT|nr:hypothetical protein [Hymenobacter montanus]MBD2766811.1 hypothetical protein [Hymenobacter montanus]
MDKLIPLFWILFAIGSVVFRIIKKMRENSVRESQERPRRPGGAVPELPKATFEELLRQMQARNAPAPAPVERTPGGRSMPHEVARPAQSQERTVLRQTSLEAPATAKPHNAPAPPARRSSGLPRASAKAPILPPTGPSAPVSTPSVNQTVRQLLRRPESVRAAFVLSEILQRKY